MEGRVYFAYNLLTSVHQRAEEAETCVSQVTLKKKSIAHSLPFLLVVESHSKTILCKLLFCIKQAAVQAC